MGRQSPTDFKAISDRIKQSQLDLSRVKPCSSKTSRVSYMQGTKLNCKHHNTAYLITLRAKFSSAVYCNGSCWFVCLWVCVLVCYYDNSKLRALIFTKLGL